MRTVDLEHTGHVTAADPVSLDDPGLRDRVADLVSLANRTYAETLRAVDTFDRRGMSSDDGFKTTKTWLVGVLGMSGPAAAGLVAAVRVLRQLPRLAAAVHGGEVSPEHVQLVVRLGGRVGISRLADVDHSLAEAAVVLDVTRFRLVCDRAAAHLDPDGADPGADFDRRGLSLGLSGSMTVLRGQLDPEGAAAVQAALDALMAPPVDGDERTAAQRRADALVDLGRLHLAAGDLPVVGGQRPQVGVLVYPQTLSRQALATIADMQGDSFAGARLREFVDGNGGDTPAPAPAVPPDPRVVFGRTPEAMRAGLVDPEAAGRVGAEQVGSDRDASVVAASAGTAAEPALLVPRSGSGAAVGAGRAVWSRPGWADPAYLDWVGSVPNEVAQRIACDADIWRIVLDPGCGMPLDVGRSYRLVPYWMRRALFARDRGCRWPGCHMPAQWADAHHLDGWFADKGQTTIERCVLACRYHHVLVHEGGWGMDLDPRTGEVSITRPDGTLYRLPRSRSPSWNGPTTTTN